MTYIEFLDKLNIQDNEHNEGVYTSLTKCVDEEKVLSLGNILADRELPETHRVYLENLQRELDVLENAKEFIIRKIQRTHYQKVMSKGVKRERLQMQETMLQNDLEETQENIEELLKILKS